MTAHGLADALLRIRRELVEEATPLPGQSRAYGRPHAHPRTRYEPRYSRTGERLPGSVKVRPDCPRPLRGRCECPPDGTWRPSVGVIRADSTAQNAGYVPTDRLPDAAHWTDSGIWVDAVYEQGPDGLWRCRRPMRRSLERLRGASVRRWAIAIRLLKGDALASVWGSHGAPPDPALEAVRILRQIERWAQEERDSDWERRPRQWWDAPRKSNARPAEKSEAQVNAEETDLRAIPMAATMPPTGRALPSFPVPRLGGGRQLERPSGPSGPRSVLGHPVPLEASSHG